MTTAADSDVVVRYEPRGAARQLFRTRDSELAIAGPAGTGKSLAALFRIHFAALNSPGIRCLVVRKTAVSLGATTLVTFEKKVAAHAIAAGIVRWFGGSPREAACYRYSNGSVIVVGGMDKPEKVLSSEYDLVFADEATELTETDWETLGTRLRNGALSWQQQIAACNPDRPQHWIKQRSDRGSMAMLHSRHRDNPAYVNADGSLTRQGRDYMNKLDALTGVRRLRYRDGIWAAAEGLIYEGWDEAVHLVDPFDIPASWTRWLAVDFGFTNPFVCQWWAEDDDGRLYLYREIYRTKRLVEDHAKHILKLVTGHDGQWTEPRPRTVICDHDAEDRATLERHLGLPTAPAKKTVSDGIQAVQSRMKAQPDGRARLALVRGALVERDPELDAGKKPTCTEEEITGYVWAVKPGAAGGLKEEPAKENDHGCFIAGTAVSTPQGPMPIEDVRPGDLVLTRVGPREVLASGMTSESAVVYQARLSTGAVLTGTGNHPVWVAGEGWKRLDALRYQDRLSACQPANPHASTESPSAATPTLQTGPTASTTRPASQTGSAVSAACMKRSGSRHTAPSLTAARSTTPTTTRTTTPWATSPASPSPSTRKPTANAAVNELGLPSSRLTSTASGPSLSSGTAPMRGEHGTASTPRSSSLAMASSAPEPASSADLNTRRPSPAPETGSAPTSARPHGGMPAASTTSSAYVPTAVPSSPSTATTPSGAAGVHVLSVSALPKPAAVFNLTVAEQPEYFAEGVLVHNCDALRYVVAHRDLVGRTRVRWL